MTTPPKTREEWESAINDIVWHHKFGGPDDWKNCRSRRIDSIMSLQAIADGAQTEIARLTTQAAGYAIEREALQAEVDKARNENTELLRSLCSANNQIEQLQTAQDEAKDALQAEVERLKAEVVSTDALADSLRFRLEEANKLLASAADLLSIKIAIKAYLESYNNWISCNCSVQYENELIEFANENRRVLFGIVGMTEKHVTSDDEIEKARQPK